MVDDCCCEIETVESHIDEFHKTILALTKTKFFRYFKVNFIRECPFWVEEYLCSISEGGGGCGVCTCEDHEIPELWKRESEAVDRTLGPGLNQWSDDDEDVWTYHDPNDQDSLYINLELNPEHHTGYGGYNSTRIWAAIYKENCFHSDGEPCFEERVFYRLLSGFHASITLSVCENYHNSTTGVSEPNTDCYFHRVGKFTDRLKNVYFTLLFLLRATQHAASYLHEYNYNTGDPSEDSQASQKISELFHLQLLQLHNPTFNDSELFSQDATGDLKRQFRAKFRNISEIMDCVACESCKVHAKLNILGIGTALKILSSTDKRESIIRNLQRNEIIALVNTLAKYSTAVQTIRKMEDRLRHKAEMTDIQQDPPLQKGDHDEL